MLDNRVEIDEMGISIFSLNASPNDKTVEEKKPKASANIVIP